MIKMEYRRMDEKTMHCHAEMYGKYNDIVDEVAAFIEDLYEKDPKMCVLAIDCFLENIGVDLEGEEEND